MSRPTGGSGGRPRERPACPACGSRRVARIVYGLVHCEPGDPFARAMERGDVVTGGCVAGEHEWHCNDCEREW